MNMSSSGVLLHLVEQNTSLLLFENAIFFAERLLYEHPSPMHRFVLGQCYHRMGKAKQAYLLLQDCDYPAAKYLFAIICVGLKKYREAEKTLLPPNFNFQKISSLTADDIPGGAAGLYLLGTISRKESRKDSAVAFLQLSLQVSLKSMRALYLLIIGFTISANAVSLSPRCGAPYASCVSLGYPWMQ